jgi:long-chain acyl-CoA synthetase
MSEPKISTKQNMSEAFAELRKLNPLLELTNREINGIDFKVFENAPKTMRDLFGAIELLQGDFPFISEDDNELSFLESMAKAKSICKFLLEEGIKPNDRVGICMQNCTEWAVIYLALAGYGATAVPFNSWWKTEELNYGIEHSEVKLIFVDPKRYELIKNHKIKKIVTEPIEGCVSYEEISNTKDLDWPDDNATDEDLTVLLYTSGSTGLPKGVMLTHLALINGLLGFYTFGALRAQIHNEQLLNVDDGSIIINVPLFHVTGLISMFLLSLLGKRKLILMYKWDTDEAIKLIKDHKVTNISGVPTQSWDLLNHPGVSKDDLNSLVDIGAGGAARPEDQVKELDDKFKIPLTFAWGMTETTALGTINRGQDYLDRPNSSGLSIPDLTEIAVIDDDWKFLATGEIGEIVFKSPSNTRGYLKNKEETDKTIQNGWLKTGDLGYLDEDGYLYIVDRKKALIIRGGENISCLEVENALDKHPEIIESCVCGIEDQKFGEIVGAYIFCSSKVTEDELKAFLKGKIADYKIPEKIKFSDSALPRIASQKLDRVGVKNLLSS